MSITTKDMVFGGATAAAFLGLIVYNETKFKKMQGEIDRLNQETKVLAQYVKLLEGQMATELHTGQHRHHHHQVGASNTSTIQGQPANPSLAVGQPEPPQAHHHNHGSHQHVHHSPGQHSNSQPGQNPSSNQHSNPASNQRSQVSHAHHQHQSHQVQQARPANAEAQTERPAHLLRRPAAAPSKPKADDSDDDQESPQNSGRRPSSSVPRTVSARSDNNRAPAARSTGQPSRPTIDQSATRRTVSRPATQSKSNGKDKEEEDDEPRPSSQRKVRIAEPKPQEEEPEKAEAPRKRFLGKTDEDVPTEKMVSSHRPKSSLKNNGAGTGDEVAMDEDLMNDIETVAKSSGRSKGSKGDNEGRPDAESGRKASAANTAARAEAMRKQSEERKAARAAKQPV